jgi:hypothetical protein
VLDNGRTILDGGGGELHITRWTTGDQGSFDVGHLDEILARTNEGEGTGARFDAH